MRIIVFSDTHKNINNCTRLLQNMPGVDLVVHLGDYVGDAYDLQILHPSLKFEIVRGNNDFEPVKTEKLIDMAGKKILITHGHVHGVKTNIQNLKDYAASVGADLALFGHTHLPYTDDTYPMMMNPGFSGSCMNATYGVVEIENGVLKTAVCRFYK